MMELIGLFTWLIKYLERSEESNFNSNEKTFRFIPDQLIHYFLFHFLCHLLKVIAYQSSPLYKFLFYFNGYSS